MHIAKLIFNLTELGFLSSKSQIPIFSVNFITLRYCSSATKNWPQAKIYNFAVKNSNIFIKWIIHKIKDYFLYTNLKHRKIMYFTNFIFKCYFFFHVALNQIFKNGAILINRGSFFQGKDSLQLDRFEFLR